MLKPSVLGIIDETLLHAASMRDEPTSEESEGPGGMPNAAPKASCGFAH